MHDHEGSAEAGHPYGHIGGQGCLRRGARRRAEAMASCRAGRGGLERITEVPEAGVIPRLYSGAIGEAGEGGAGDAGVVCISASPP